METSNPRIAGVNRRMGKVYSSPCLSLIIIDKQRYEIFVVFIINNNDNNNTNNNNNKKNNNNIVVQIKVGVSL